MHLTKRMREGGRHASHEEFEGGWEAVHLTKRVKEGGRQCISRRE